MTYRESFRVEEKVRPLTAEEETRVRAERERWHAAAAAHEPNDRAELIGAIIVVIGIAAFGVVGKDLVTAAIAASVFLFVGWLAMRGRWRARKRLAAGRKGPWDCPPGVERWQALETLVVARSIVGAVSDDEDYSAFLLFEIPGQAWFFVDSVVLPNEHPDLARAELRFVTLHPQGVMLSIEAAGDPIPRRGAKLGDEGYSQAVDHGFVWRPEDASWTGNGEGRIPEGALPDWMRRLTV